jgi:hypothetical protein
MTTWSDIESEAPELASGGRQLLFQYDIGLAFLATVRPDGGPRLHPICVIEADGVLYAALVPSPKTRDLQRDGRFALHSFPPENVDDEFALTGIAVKVEDPARRADAQQHYRNPIAEHDLLFELQPQTALLARYRHRGDWPPTYSRWRAGRGVDHPVSGSVAA